MNTINNINSRNIKNVSNYHKTSFNNNSNYNKVYNINNIPICYRLNSIDSHNIRDIILKDKLNNENKQKISLPNLNKGLKKNRRILVSAQKNKKNKIDEISTNNSLKKYSSWSLNHHYDLKENYDNSDNIKINLLSSISKSSNIFIPIGSLENKNNNNLKDENYKNDYENLDKNIKHFNRINNRIEKENSKNNLNEIFTNKTNFYKKNKLLKHNYKKYLLENNNLNLLLSIDNSFMPKLHKIKIGKGVEGSKILDNFLKTSDNNIIKSKLPLIYDRNNLSKSQQKNYFNYMNF